MLFETERVSVRQWTSDDLSDLHNLYADPGMSDYIGPKLHISETKRIFEDQLFQYNNTPGLGRFVIIDKLSSSFIGILLIRTLEEKNSVELGYAFKKDSWGKGLATEVVSESLQHIFQSTPFSTIYAFTELNNFNSKNVLSKCGFFQLDDIYQDGEEMNSFCITNSKVK